MTGTLTTYICSIYAALNAMQKYCIINLEIYAFNE